MSSKLANKLDKYACNFRKNSCILYTKRQLKPDTKPIEDEQRQRNILLSQRFASSKYC